MTDLRKIALELAIQARTSAGEDVVATAERFHTFLSGGRTASLGSADVMRAINEAQPPQIPTGSLSDADQTPTYIVEGTPGPTLRGVVKLAAGPHDPFGIFDEEDVPTRLVKGAE